MAELECRTNNTPDDGCGAEDLSAGANETVGLMLCTHPFDILKHPGLDSELYSSRNSGANNLGKEHRTRRYYAPDI